MVTNLEQDEIETEVETQRRQRDGLRLSILSHFVLQLEAPAASAETVEMGQTNQNVLRLLEDDEKVCLLLDVRARIVRSF